MTRPERSLFRRLWSARPGEKRERLEDFLTEAFAGVMEREPALCARWLSEVLRLDVASVDRVETQRRFVATTPDGGAERPDVWITTRDGSGGRGVVAIESKVASGAGKGQLERYAKVVSREVTTRGYVWGALVYLTPRSHDEHPPPPSAAAPLRFVHWRWPDVYAWLRRAEGEVVESAGVPLVRELARYLEELGMNQEAALEPGDVEAFSRVGRLARFCAAALDGKVARRAVEVFGREPKRSGAGFDPERRGRWVTRFEHSDTIGAGLGFFPAADAAGAVLSVWVECYEKTGCYPAAHASLVDNDGPLGRAAWVLYDGVDFGFRGVGRAARLSVAALSAQASGAPTVEAAQRWFLSRLEEAAEFRRVNPSLAWGEATRPPPSALAP